MRKNITLLLLLLTAALTTLPLRADVVFDETNFPDANFRQYLKDNFSGKGFTTEGVTITTANLNSITSISCSSKSIASLKGIEHFTELKELYCYSNQLTDLDVSHNTALTGLDCDYNQLTELDVTHNTELIVLESFRNQLTRLDVTGCTALTRLKCNANKLTELDISTNTALIELICGSNQLTALDVTQNTALTKLNCDANQLTELDVSDCTALTTLDCSGNKLTELDVTQNAALTTLICNFNLLTELDVFYNTELAKLICSSNQLTELDVTKNTKLEYFSCGFNDYISSLDVSENKALKELNCAANRISKLDVSNNFELTALSCYLNGLRTLDVSHNTKLKFLRCGYNFINQLDLSYSISTLHCEECELERLCTNSLPLLDTLYCQNNKLVELDLSNNQKLTYFKPEGQKREIKAEVGWTIKNNKEIKFYYLSLDGKAGQGNGMQTLAQKLGVADFADEWWSRVRYISGAVLLKGSRKAVNPNDIDPTTVYGDILVLYPNVEGETEASGSVNYRYNMNSNSTVFPTALTTVFTLNWTADPQVVTDVMKLGDGIEVPMSEVQFVNPAGQVSDTPWLGVNIVVTRYSDGTTETSKVLK